MRWCAAWWGGTRWSTRPCGGRNVAAPLNCRRLTARPPARGRPCILRCKEPERICNGSSVSGGWARQGNQRSPWWTRTWADASTGEFPPGSVFFLWPLPSLGPGVAMLTPARTIPDGNWHRHPGRPGGRHRPEAACFPRRRRRGGRLPGCLAAFPTPWLLVEGPWVLAMVTAWSPSSPTSPTPCTTTPPTTPPAWQMIFGVATHQRTAAAGVCRHPPPPRHPGDPGPGKAGLVLTCKEKLVPYHARFGFVSEGPRPPSTAGAAWYQMRLRV